MGGWQGQFDFGDGWAAYRGPVGDLRPHAHVALQIAVSERGQVTVQTDAGRVESAGVVVAPLVRHLVTVDGGPVSAFYLEPRASFARALLQRLEGVSVAPLPRDLYQAVIHQTPFEGMKRLQAVLGGSSPDVEMRVEAAFDAAARHRGPGGVAHAAKIAGLSPQRLRALARELFGVPLSQWLLWRKLGFASRAIARGATLSAAAAAGGFADQAHFSRTMRRMFGVTPGEAVQPLRAKA